MGWTYILRCSDGSFYVGSTADLAGRLAKHQDGSASAYTRQHRPVTLVYSEEFPSILAAVARERQIKRWTRAKKEALVGSEKAKLKALAQSGIRRLRGKLQWAGNLDISRLSRTPDKASDSSK